MTFWRLSILIVAAITAATSSWAYAGEAMREECPQGRQIRAQKAYPSALTDCEVLDADTATENQRVRRRPSAAAPPKSQPTQTAGLAVEMSVAAMPGNPPLIIGKTNLPDGTILSVTMVGEPPGCVPRCGLGPADTIVENGHFVIGEKLTGIGKLLASNYRVDVNMTARDQSNPTVKSVIGANGELLRGPYVVSWEDGPSLSYISIRFPRTSPPSEGEKRLGLMINYTERLAVH